jgi:hypothetical protein
MGFFGISSGWRGGAEMLWHFVEEMVAFFFAVCGCFFWLGFDLREVQIHGKGGAWWEASTKNGIFRET